MILKGGKRFRLIFPSKTLLRAQKLITYVLKITSGKKHLETIHLLKIN